MMSTAMLLFVFSLISEVLWIMWGRSVTAQRRNLVALSSVSITAVSYCSVWIVVECHYMLIPALAGHVIGAYIGMSKIIPIIPIGKNN